jgi:hypothetical protein
MVARVYVCSCGWWGEDGVHRLVSSGNSGPFTAIRMFCRSCGKELPQWEYRIDRLFPSESYKQITDPMDWIDTPAVAEMFNISVEVVHYLIRKYGLMCVTIFFTNHRRQEMIRKFELDAVIKKVNRTYSNKIAPGEVPENTWIAVYPDLTIEHFRKPAKDAEVLLWVRRYKARNDPGFRHRYRYKLYSADMKPGFVRHGNFSFVALYDRKGTSKHNREYREWFYIMDRNQELKYFKAESTDESAIIEAIKFLGKLEDYRDWDEFDGMNEVYQKSGLSEDEFHAILARDLLGIGIILQERVKG